MLFLGSIENGYIVSPVIRTNKGRQSLDKEENISNAAFCGYNKDQKCFISVADLRRVMKKGIGLEDKNITLFYREADTDGKGEFNYEIIDSYHIALIIPSKQYW